MGTCRYRMCYFIDVLRLVGESIFMKYNINESKRVAEFDDNKTLKNLLMLRFWLSNDYEVHHYDFHVVYSLSYRVPVLYFRVYYDDGQLLSLNEIQKDLPTNSAKVLMESKWTFMTQEEHPYLNRPWYTLHPRGTSEWMKLLLSSDSSTVKCGLESGKYLVSWFLVVGQVFGLKIPYEMLRSEDNTS